MEYPPFARALLTGALTLSLLSSCNWGYGAPVDRATFGTAQLHADGTRCVFALHDVVYRPAEGLRAFPDGGIPRYDVDRHKLGIVDVRSGEVTLLVDEKNRDWLRGHGGFQVTGLGDRFALVHQAGQREDHQQGHRWWRLDLGSGDLAPLPLDEELAAEGRAIGRVEVADADFSLIVVTEKGDVPQEVWSRSANGRLRRLAVTDHYYGAADGEIWWYDVTARAGARSDYRTGATARERRANFAMPRREPQSGCRPRHDRRELVFQQKVGGAWRDRTLPVTASDLR